MALVCTSARSASSAPAYSGRPWCSSAVMLQGMARGRSAKLFAPLMRISTFYCFSQGDAAERKCAQQLQRALQSTSIRACSSTHQP